MTIRILKTESFQPLGPAIKKTPPDAPKERWLPTGTPGYLRSSTTGAVMRDPNAPSKAVTFRAPPVKADEPIADAAGWIAWDGGECPVSDPSGLEVRWGNGVVWLSKGFLGQECTNQAYAPCWRHERGEPALHIVAYRVVKPTVEEEATEKLPHGWVPWAGGMCPVDATADVEIMLRCGHEGRSNAGSYSWDHLAFSTDIIAYKVIEPAVSEKQIPTLGDIANAWAWAGSGQLGIPIDTKYKAVTAAYGGKWVADISKVPVEYRRAVYDALMDLAP